ncbi:MEDS domain-containing protein [Mycolicibacter sp. MYC123]|uniref:MEDS domain-containing protein n=1 Tax=[Mycobacterium] zoologicum TaxID=2872311 RepID=A0ABU5YIC6_9MYCO|nr:MEDS domain-containing protein [Mycolicibacter sp. MYC123]MEB3048749.1 MEDS domain-containing protein [Mycolicibacter sp. MYC123]
MMGAHRADPSGEYGHIGWQYRDYAEFLDRAAQYLAVGLSLGQRTVYVGDGEPAALRAALATAGLGRGASQVDLRTVPEHFAFRKGSDVVDAEAMTERYAAAAIGAVAEGYSGLRVVIDVTPVARTPEQREAQAALEFLGDRRISTLPVAAMCGFDVNELGDAAAGLLCLHPTAGPDSSVPFQLYTQPAHHNAIALAGNLDAASEPLFLTTLQRVLPLLSRDTLEIDARELEFVGHRQLCLLDRSCAAHGRTALLRSARAVVHRLVDLLEFGNVRIETTA